MAAFEEGTDWDEVDRIIEKGPPYPKMKPSFMNLTPQQASKSAASVAR